MDNQDKQLVKEAVKEAITETMPNEVHAEHHKFVEHLILRQRRCEERREKVFNHVMGWVAISAITGLGYAVFHYLRHIFKS